CDQEFDLLVDDERAGRVPAGQEVAFQTRAGRRSLCLRPADDEAAPACGQPGTIRTAYIHDGWALVTHCSE
ncbi:MAG: hypothetical protein AAGC55_28730, partial [Myxococcota bacterium]